LISPVAVCPAQNTSPGTFTAGPVINTRPYVNAETSLINDATVSASLTVVWFGGELVVTDQFARHGDDKSLSVGGICVTDRNEVRKPVLICVKLSREAK
jgi:hypothetical protein